MSDDHIQSETPEPPYLAKRPRPLADDPFDPKEHNDLPKLGSLGSLAQSARNKHLNEARKTLLILGILMVVLQTVFYFQELGKAKEQIRKHVDLTPEQIQQADVLAQAILVTLHGFAIAVGLSFVGLSFFVPRYPVPALVTALVLYLGAQLCFALVNKWNILNFGIIVKIIIILGLVKALQAGLAARREEREAAAAAEYGA